jgi:hypothetical protein
MTGEDNGNGFAVGLGAEQRWGMAYLTSTHKQRFSVFQNNQTPPPRAHYRSLFLIGLINVPPMH